MTDRDERKRRRGARCGSRTTSSGWPIPSGRRSWRTATGCSAPSTTPRTWSRRRTCGPGGPTSGFEGRASLRTWLYRIATNACLTALEHRAGVRCRPGIGAPHTEPEGDLSAIPPEITWLQPIPDALLSPGISGAAGADPASVVAARAGLRLALVAALQYLPPRQRAVLILRDVLGWRAAEVAALLGLTVTAVNSLLKRARARLAEVAPDVEEVAEPTEAEQREILDRWATAFVEADVDTLMELLTEDAIYEMPPQPMWFQGAPMPAPAAGLPPGQARQAPPDGPDHGQRPARLRGVLRRRRPAAGRGVGAGADDARREDRAGDDVPDAGAGGGGGVPDGGDGLGDEG